MTPSRLTNSRYVVQPSHDVAATARAVKEARLSTYTGACAQCGGQITRKRSGRRARFCSDACRLQTFRGRFVARRAAPKAPTADSPSNGHFVSKIDSGNNALRGQKTPLEKAGLSWTRINDVTWKLANGRSWRTPASFGQWGGYDTQWPVAWVIDTGWVTGRPEWHAHCGAKSYGPTTFALARQAAFAMATGASLPARTGGGEQ